MTEKIKIEGIKVGELYRIATQLADGYGTEAKIKVVRDGNQTFIRVHPRETT
jgi:hypothetical protein